MNDFLLGLCIILAPIALLLIILSVVHPEYSPFAHLL